MEIIPEIIEYVTISQLGNGTDFGNLAFDRRGGGTTSDS